MTVTIISADFHNSKHAKDLVMLLDAYAQDPMGGGEGLSEYVKNNLVKTLAKRYDFLTLLAYVDGKPAGILNCVKAFQHSNANLYSIFMIAGYCQSIVAKA